MTPSRAPSMADVARVAGVSHQTVSRVVNDHPSVLPTTRERVLEAIAELGYRPNTAARALVTRRTDTIGILSTGSELYGPASTVAAVEEAARERGWFVSLASVRTFEPERLAAVLDHFMAQSVEGIVVVAPQDDVAAAVAAMRTERPVVMIAALDGEPPRPGVFPIAVDQRAGARAATDHLLDLGHRSVLHLAGPSDWFDARQRERGWTEAHVARGIEPPPVVRCDWSARAGYEAARRIGAELVAGGGPTAVFAANDQLALGALSALWELGLDVPGDVSVAGFDDIAGAAYFVPSLTTVGQPFVPLGRSCLEVLAAAIEGRPVGPRLIAPTLVARASTAPPRSGAVLPKPRRGVRQH